MRCRPRPQILRDRFQSGRQTKEIELDLPKIIAEERTGARSPKPKDEVVWGFPVSILEDEPIIEAVQIVEEEMLLPDEAVEIITDFGRTEHAALV